MRFSVIVIGSRSLISSITGRLYCTDSPGNPCGPSPKATAHIASPWLIEMQTLPHALLQPPASRSSPLIRRPRWSRRGKRRRKQYQSHPNQRRDHQAVTRPGQLSTRRLQAQRLTKCCLTRPGPIFPALSRACPTSGISAARNIPVSSARGRDRIWLGILEPAIDNAIFLRIQPRIGLVLANHLWNWMPEFHGRFHQAFFRAFHQLVRSWTAVCDADCSPCP